MQDINNRKNLYMCMREREIRKGTDGNPVEST